MQYQEDRDLTERLVADTEYLTREIAAVRIATGDLATRDFLRGEVRDLADELTELLAQGGQSPATAGSSTAGPGPDPLTNVAPAASRRDPPPASDPEPRRAE